MGDEQDRIRPAFEAVSVLLIGLVAISGAVIATFFGAPPPVALLLLVALFAALLALDVIAFHS